MPTVARVDEPESIDRARFDSPQRNLVGRGPLAVIAHQIDRHTGRLALPTPAGDAVVLAKILRELPRTVGAIVLESQQQRAARQFGRSTRDRATVTVVAAGQCDERSKAVAVGHVRRARR